MNGSREVDGEIDAAWTSDLKDAHADGGRTVAGTADPEPGNTDTTAWPSALDRSNYTAKREAAIEAAVLYGSDLEAVTDAADVSDATLRTALTAAIEEAGGREHLPINVEALDPITAHRSEIEEMIRDGCDSAEIGERFGIAPRSIGAMRGYIDPSPRAVNEDAESVMSEGSDLERIETDPTQGRETAAERPRHTHDPRTGYDAGTVAAVLLALLALWYLARGLVAVVRR